MFCANILKNARREGAVVAATAAIQALLLAMLFWAEFDVHLELFTSIFELSCYRQSCLDRPERFSCWCW